MSRTLTTKVVHAKLIETLWYFIHLNVFCNLQWIFFPFFIWTYAVCLPRWTFDFEPKKKVVYAMKNVLKQRKYYESLINLFSTLFYK